MTYPCNSCGLTIPANEAHIRGTGRRQLAWCRPCWRARVPVQRVSWDAMVAEVEAYANGEVR